MKLSRSLLLIASGLVMVLLLGGGLIVKVGAAENSYRQAVLFAEILSQVLDNYVDPVEADALLSGPYEGMLSSLDPNGAFLSPQEVEAWKEQDGREPGEAGPGVAVLKGSRALQVVAVEAGSPADEAGIRVGDHIRSVDGSSVRDLSLVQARRMIEGSPGTVVHLEVVHPSEGFRREALELERSSRGPVPYVLEVDQGTAVLRIHDLRELPLEDLAAELDDVRSRPIETLLLDLRNLASGDPRDAVKIAAVFLREPRLELRDRSGRLVESLAPEGAETGWTGELAVLVNGATAEGAEALALLLRDRAEVTIYGETTFGLGAEPTLFELQNGAGLLLSSAMWKTGAGVSWHEKGVEPDETVEGEGRDFAAVFDSQLEQVLEILSSTAEDEVEEKEAA
jgi:carboxyl-terminal processing protease